MERFVHRQNVEHYRALLRRIADPEERRKIEKMLAEEEAALKETEQNAKNK